MLQRGYAIVENRKGQAVRPDALKQTERVTLRLADGVTQPRFAARTAANASWIYKPMAQPWFLYVLACQGGGLYTGVYARCGPPLGAHASARQGRAGYTRSFPPQQLALVVEFANQGEALCPPTRAVKTMRAADKRAWLLSCGGQLPAPSMSAQRLQSGRLHKSLTAAHQSPRGAGQPSACPWFNLELTTIQNV